jgi:hypothetical protein
MDFTAFLDNVSIDNIVVVPGTWANGTTVDANNGAGVNSIVVLSTNGASLAPADFSTGIAGTIQLEDNGRAVVVVGQDQTGPGSGIGTFDIYYVQDINTGAGQTWVVDMVATVEAATRVGVAAVVDNLMHGQSIFGDAGNDVFASYVGPQSYDLNGTADRDIVQFVATVGPRDTTSFGVTGADTVDNFDIGASATTNDAIDLSDWYFDVALLDATPGGAVTPYVLGAGDVALGGQLALFNAAGGNLVDTPTEVAALVNLAGTTFSLVAGGQGMLITGDAGNSTALLWDLDDVNGNGTLDVGVGFWEVTLVAELNLVGGTNDITGFYPSNLLV